MSIGVLISPIGPYDVNLGLNQSNQTVWWVSESYSVQLDHLIYIKVLINPIKPFDEYQGLD